MEQGSPTPAATNGPAPGTAYRAATVSAIVVAPVRLYREGIAASLRHADIGVVGEAADLAAALGLVAGGDVDVVVLDLALAEGLGAIATLRRAAAHSAVVVVGVRRDERSILACAEAGASGYVDREADVADLVDVVSAVVREELPCPPRIASALWRRVAHLAASFEGPWGAGLTVREREVASFMDLGLSNKEIATRLHVEPATVKNHVQSILRKTGCHSRGEAAARLRRTTEAHTPGVPPEAGGRR